MVYVGHLYAHIYMHTFEGQWRYTCTCMYCHIHTHAEINANFHDKHKQILMNSVFSVNMH